MQRRIILDQGKSLGLRGPDAPSQATRARGGRVRGLRRSLRHLQAVGVLDAPKGAHISLEEAIAAIYEEYSVGEAVPVSLVAKCFLGEPHDVHICALDGSIVEHYVRGRAMPPLEERARRMAGHDAYLFVEVYSDGKLACVRADGSVTVY